jgi:putative phage-type endonuclease
MITKDRFLAKHGTPEWHAMRKTGVSATAVAKACTPAGFETAVREIWQGADEIPDNDFMRFGREQEGNIIDDLQTMGHEVEANEWLIAAEGYTNRWQMATPDGLSKDHKTIVEVKTTGKDFVEWGKVPLQYRRQVQWQLYVTGATQCLFAWQLRVTNNDGLFVPGWLEPKAVIVQRDEEMITQLVSVSEKLQMELIHREQADLVTKL